MVFVIMRTCIYIFSIKGGKKMNCVMYNGKRQKPLFLHAFFFLFSAVCFQRAQHRLQIQHIALGQSAARQNIATAITIAGFMFHWSKPTDCARLPRFRLYETLKAGRVISLPREPESLLHQPRRAAMVLIPLPT